MKSVKQNQRSDPSEAKGSLDELTSEVNPELRRYLILKTASLFAGLLRQGFAFLAMTDKMKG